MPDKKIASEVIPGCENSRDLKHAIERACMLSTAKVIAPDTLFGDWDLATFYPAAASNFREYLDVRERNYIAHVLGKHAGQIGKTATSPVISHKNLREKLKRLGTVR